MNAPSSPLTLLFLPCSATKNSPLHAVFPAPGRALLTVLSRSAEALREGRQELADCVDWQSPEFAALDYYDGALYQVPGLRAAVGAAMRSGGVDVVILSGGYGAVYADEPIHRYEEKMDFAYWKIRGLPAVLEECIELSGARTVYGFLARTTAYARILRAVNWAELRRRNRLAEAGLFYLEFPGREGAQSKVPPAIGGAVVEFIAAGFDRPRLLAKDYEGYRFAYEELGA